MRKLMSVLSLMALLFISCSDSLSSDNLPESSTQTLVEGNTEFAVDLYNKLAQSDGNVFFSPYSVSSALAMTYAGARGNTAAEMEQALRFHLGRDNLHPAFNYLNNTLMDAAREDEHKLNIANGLSLTRGDVSEEFKALLKKYYDAEIFHGDLDKINSWVEDKTEGKIETILDELHPLSVCVLLNAVYFNADWASQFDHERTHDAPFNVSSDEQVTVDMMYQQNDFQLLEKDKFQAVSIPYKGNKMSMVILLPSDVDGITKLEAKLTHEKLLHWLDKLDNQSAREIELFLPKYELETEYDLSSAFKEMGMKDAFGTDADFTGMGWPKGELFISQIKHKAFVSVDEEGTEAAAATAVEMRTTAMPFYPVFRADRPFIFLIRENQTGSILFVGRIANPAD